MRINFIQIYSNVVVYAKMKCLDHALCIRLCIEKCIGKNLWPCILNGGARAKISWCQCNRIYFSRQKKILNAFVILTAFPIRTGYDAGKIESIKVKKDTSFCFSLRFRLVKCAMLISYSFSLRDLSNSGSFLFSSQIN